MDKKRDYLAACLLFVPCLLLTGCGGGATEGRKPVYPTSGRITMSGSPVIGATVSFAPREGQPVAMGRTNDAGEYVLTTYDGGDGAASGRFSVVVNKSVSVAAASTDAAHSPDGSTPIPDGHDANSESEATQSGLIPDIYTDSNETPFSATVEAGGENKFDFDIK